MNNRREIFIVICLSALLLLLPTLLYAWTGYDYDTEGYVEIDEDISAIQGKDIEIYDYSDEPYHEVYVIFVYSDGTEIEVFDHDTGDYKTFELEEDCGQNYTEVLWQTSLSNKL